MFSSILRFTMGARLASKRQSGVFEALGLGLPALTPSLRRLGLRRLGLRPLLGLRRLGLRPLGLKLLGLMLLGLVLGPVGCSKQLIPNTDVEDTDFNRNVVQFCEEYRRAVERRNTALLLKLADERYYEDGGNVDASDDLDYQGLRDYLEERFRHAKAIRYEIRYRRVGAGEDDRIFVDFTYSASYKLPTSEGDVWRRQVADNRLELRPHGETFKILSGM